MSVMIWDDASQAFKETEEVPKRYDAVSGAWMETTGMAYDDAAGAWTERWNKDKLKYLYNYGNINYGLTGGLQRAYNVSSSDFNPIFNENHILCDDGRTSLRSWAESGIATVNPIDLSNVNFIRAIVDTMKLQENWGPLIELLNDPSGWHGGISSPNVIKRGKDSGGIGVNQEIYLDVSEYTGKIYIALIAAGYAGFKIKKIWFE